MRYFFWLLLWLFSLQPLSSADNSLKIIKLASSYVGVTETGRNSGDSVNKFLAAVRLKPGAPWCAAFVRYILDLAQNSFIKIRSGLALKYITKKSIPAKHVAKGYKKAFPGWLVIWKHANTWKGHIGFVQQWSKNSGTTIEGNTTPDGKTKPEGVFRKNRKIFSYKMFRIIFFTPTYDKK